MKKYVSELLVHVFLSIFHWVYLYLIYEMVIKFLRHRFGPLGSYAC